MSETPSAERDVSCPRDEYWTRMEGGQEQRVHVPVEIGEWVQVSYELLAQMLTDLGWTKTTEPEESA